MIIRNAKSDDIDSLVEIDRGAYGKTGATKDYFFQKLSEFPEGILAVEHNGNVTGFIVFEIYNKNDVPGDFRSMKLNEPISGKWMFTIAFTTATNYKNKKEDTKLLLQAENVAKEKGCVWACVPLSKDHPFEVNGVFEFWEQNGYKKDGTISWVANSEELVECYFLRKRLN